VIIETLPNGNKQNSLILTKDLDAGSTFFVFGNLELQLAYGYEQGDESWQEGIPSRRFIPPNFLPEEELERRRTLAASCLTLANGDPRAASVLMKERILAMHRLR